MMNDICYAYLASLPRLTADEESWEVNSQNHTQHFHWTINIYKVESTSHVFSKARSSLVLSYAHKKNAKQVCKEPQ